MLKALLRLGVRERVVFEADPDTLRYSDEDPELGRVLKRAEGILTKVAEELATGSESQGDDPLKWVSQAMQKEGLRRGLNKEERCSATLGELFDLRDKDEEE